MEIPKPETKALEPIVESEEDLRLAIFLNAENEKCALATFLQDDIVQLLNDLKNESNLNISSKLLQQISQSLDDVQNTITELKPDVAQAQGLLAELKALCAHHFNISSQSAFDNFIKVPDDLTAKIALAIYRLSEQTLACINVTYLSGFSMGVKKLEEGLMRITYRFAFNPNAPLLPRTDFAEKLRLIVYLLSGKLVFREYAQHGVEVIVYLEEAIFA